VKRKFFPILLSVSLSVNLLAVIGAAAFIYRKGGIPWLEHKMVLAFSTVQTGLSPGLYPNPNHQLLTAGPYKDSKLSVYEQLAIGPNDIVFIGDSIMDLGEWSELFEDRHAKKRTLDGDDTHTVLSRLGAIIEGKPRHVVFLCGINNFQKGIPYAQTTQEYAQIVAMLSFELPDTHLWLLQVFPVNTQLYERWIVPAYPSLIRPTRAEVEKLNDYIATLAVARSRTHFVKMPSLLDSSGELGEVYTLDGLHLNGRGLKEVAAHLRQLLFQSVQAQHTNEADRL
jgi:lysophospholipase L1-like esterase